MAAGAIRAVDCVLVDGQLDQSKYKNENGRSKKAKPARFQARHFRSATEPGGSPKPVAPAVPDRPLKPPVSDRNE